MPISSIAIDNFRGLRDFRMEGAAPVFNLLVGPSEIGKTTVLEAMGLMSVPANMMRVIEINRLRGVAVNSQIDAVAASASLFYKFHLQPIELQAAIKSELGDVQMNVEITPVMDDKVVSYQDTDTQMRGVASASTGRFDGLKYAVEFTGAVSGEGYYFLRFRDNDINLEPFVEKAKLCRADKTGGKHALSATEEKLLLLNPILIRSPDPQTAISEATVNKKKPAIVEILRKINPQIAGFDLSDKAPLIDIGLDQMVPLHIAGDGLRRVLGTLGNLCSKKYNVHLDDEIGAGVYFGAQAAFLRAVLRFAKQEGKQIFATTHNKDVLVALREVLTEEEDLREDAAVFSFMRDKHGKVRAGAYPYEDIDRCIANGIEMR